MATITPIAYNTGSTISGTLQYGSLSVANSAQDYGVVGANNSVKYYGTPDQDLGYVIAYPDSTGGHNGKPGNVPAYMGFVRTPDFTDSSFINSAQFVSTIFNTPQTFTSSTQANTWLLSNGYWNSYSSVITDGLTLALDAGNSLSYSGSGNIWYDLAGTQQNITLVNSPTFTSGATSYFNFLPSSSQYGTGSGQVLQSTGYTKSVWFYLNTLVADNNLVSSDTGGHYMFLQGGNKIYAGNSNWAGFPNNLQSVTTFSAGTWYNATVTFNTTDGMKLYVNGVLDATYTAVKTAFTGNGSINIGSYSAGGNLLNGRISKVYCFDRSITATEVLRMYNATKSNF